MNCLPNSYLPNSYFVYLLQTSSLNYQAKLIIAFTSNRIRLNDIKPISTCQVSCHCKTLVRKISRKKIYKSQLCLLKSTIANQDSVRCTLDTYVVFIDYVYPGAFAVIDHNKGHALNKRCLLLQNVISNDQLIWPATSPAQLLLSRRL